ncbi:winged helix-turn-helix transcriptional regulator [Nonomuraea sp. NPDC048826]|uniref:winged helix-turn-helix transcriptional regulator n=1 Tax=Nonomuraea sp. NPDC048826 TaxID=3364347 RepID=UPI00372033AF
MCSPHLTEAGVLARRREPGWPSRVHYTLTAQGQRLGPVLQALWDWGAQHHQPPPSTET